MPVNRAWWLSAALSAASLGCVEKPANRGTSPSSPPSASSALDVQINAAVPANIPLERRGDAMVVALRADVHECDERCMRTRGPSFLRLLRVAYRMPERMRRILQAVDTPYARLWMAWISWFEGEETEARTYLREARVELRQDATRTAIYQQWLRRITEGQSGPPTLAQELTAEMRTQLDHWASLDPELGAEAARVLPCFMLARAGAASVTAFRPAQTATDALATGVVLRCVSRVVDDRQQEAERTALRGALTALETSLTALVARPGASSDLARARAFEPLFAPTYAVAPFDDAALVRWSRTAAGASIRASVGPWLRARGDSLQIVEQTYCAMARQADATITAAQCAQRLRSALNSAAQLWASSPVVVAERDL